MGSSRWLLKLHLRLSISTALMRHRRPKQYCLQLVIYIYIYKVIYMLKIFNKHTLKLSYSCMPNMKSIISSHNKALLSDYHRSQTQTNKKECNCRKKDQCPLDGKCLTQNVVYQATVSTQSSSETYVGLATNFKERYRNHTASFRHQSKRNETELSKHIWALKGNNKPFNIKWRIIKQCRPYSNVSNKCNLCLFEKFIIICGRICAV